MYPQGVHIVNYREITYPRVRVVSYPCPMSLSVLLRFYIFSNINCRTLTSRSLASSQLSPLYPKLANALLKFLLISHACQHVFTYTR